MRVKLRASEQRFLESIHQVSFSNPFSEETQELHLSLSGLNREASLLELYQAVHAKLGRVLDRCLPGGLLRIQDVDPAQQEMLAFAMLYRMLLDISPELDQLIESRDTLDSRGGIAFPGASVWLERLEAMGFRQPEACKRLSMLFQIRRAYFYLTRTLVGNSYCMQELRRRLWRNMFTADIRWYVGGLWERMEDFSLLLLGETGSGKGTAASAVGRSVYIPFDAKRLCFVAGVENAFLEINLAEFASGVLESELFGHRKGAFTGAVDHNTGLFGLCPPYGTVFLDEVGELSEAVQVKLLRVLQERRFSPVGSRERKRFEGRVIAATNRPLDQLGSPGGLREDLYYRISSDRVEVPSLRQRLEEQPDELARLAGYLLRRITGWSTGALQDRVLSCLQESIPEGYAWPGNVRELEQALRRILLTGSYHPQPAAVQPERSLPLEQARRLPLQERMELLRKGYVLYGTYAEVSRRSGLDRRTVKKLIEQS